VLLMKVLDFVGLLGRVRPAVGCSALRRIADDREQKQTERGFVIIGEVGKWSLAMSETLFTALQFGLVVIVGLTVVAIALKIKGG
jgi:hypothetical protein